MMHMANRIADPVVLRSTIAAAALMSAVIRVAVFAFSGLLAVKGLWIAVAALLPCLIVGVNTGRWLQRIFAPKVNRALIYALLVTSGASLIWRFA